MPEVREAVLRRENSVRGADTFARRCGGTVAGASRQSRRGVLRPTKSRPRARRRVGVSVSSGVGQLHARRQEGSGPVIPFLANSLWFGSCLPEAAAFRLATRDVAETQRRVLQRITGFCSVEEFQERVPLSDEPVATSEPVIRRVPTSGTTGPTKWIPYTTSLYREFRRGIAPWIVDLFKHNPAMLRGRSYWAISP